MKKLVRMKNKKLYSFCDVENFLSREELKKVFVCLIDKKIRLNDVNFMLNSTNIGTKISMIKDGKEIADVTDYHSW